MNVVFANRWLIAFFVSLVGLGAFAQDASANASARYQQQIQQFKSMLAEQAEADTENVSEKDRALTEKWLQEAEVLLANGNNKAVEIRLRRVEYALDLVRALVTASTIDNVAERQEQYFHTAQEQIAKFEIEIQEMQRKKEALQRDLQRSQ